jgi:hypothetical protein
VRFWMGLGLEVKSEGEVVWAGRDGWDFRRHSQGHRGG